MNQTMYYKGAPKSGPNNHRIFINFISKIDQLGDTVFMIICRIHIIYM